MSAYQKNLELQKRLETRGIEINLDQAAILRKAEITLNRWAELECGDGNDYQSWSIERDEKTGKPFMCYYPHTGKNRKDAIRDLEAGALKRVAKLCKVLGLSFYQQGDPRGGALYVSKEKLDSSNYTHGVYVGVN